MSAEPHSDRSTLPFFAGAFALAWTLWGAAALVDTDLSLPLGARALLFLPGTFAPALVALALTWRRDGGAGVAALLEGIGRWRLPVRWYAFALGYLAAAKLLAAAGHRLLTGAWPLFGATPVVVMVTGAVLSTPFQAGEEIGWRGYALSRMARRWGTGGASVVLGVVWAAWHIPLFLIPGTGTTGQPFHVYALSVTALSVAMAWLWARTGASLLLVMLMHAAVNNTAGVVSTAGPGVPGPFYLNASLAAWLTAAVLWSGAAWFLFRLRLNPRADPGVPASGIDEARASPFADPAP